MPARRGIATSRDNRGGFERHSLRRCRRLLRRRERGLTNQVDYTCICFFQFRVLNREFIRRRFDLFAIVRDEQRRLLLYSQCAITFDPDADGVCKLCALFFLRNQLALSLLCQKTAFDQHSRHLR